MLLTNTTHYCFCVRPTLWSTTVSTLVKVSDETTNYRSVTRGRTDHFAASVTYLQFPIQVCISATLPELVFPVSLSVTAKTSYDLGLWTWPKQDQSEPSRQISLHQRSLCLQVITWTHTVDGLKYTDHSMVNKAKHQRGLGLTITEKKWHWYHRLRGSASPVLTATGLVNGRWQFSTPYRIDTP